MNAKRGQGAKVQIDIRDFELDGMIPSLLAKADDLGGSIRGKVRGGTVEFADGQSISDLTITLLRKEKDGDIELPMRFAGKIGMTDQWLKVKDPTGTEGFVAAWFVAR